MGLGMQRWYISRSILPATREDFTYAVEGLQEDIEKLTKDKFQLKISFYKAAQKPEPGPPLKTRADVLLKSITNIRELSTRDWKNADLIVAELTPIGALSDKVTPDQVKVLGAKLSVKWPDYRRIDFDIKTDSPQSDRAVCHRFQNQRFTFWAKGLHP